METGQSLSRLVARIPGLTWSLVASCLLGLLASCATDAGTNQAEITTEQGAVRGTIAADYHRFQGIPFAAPPVGDLRWAPPKPPASWGGVRDARESGPRCAQVSAFGDSQGSTAEDCLYLDVTTPAQSPADSAAKGHPVMVWLHGGGFTEGAGSDADARRLAVDGDVVVVTINYRLGIFGLFGLPGLPDSGTFALQDQIAGLDWVKQNAAAFGGDPTNVTVFGESAGAKSICALLTTPDAAGLFHRAIMQSGPCNGTVPAGMMFPGVPEFDQWMSQSDRAAMGSETAESLNCRGADPITCLRELPAEKLMAHHNAFATPAFGGDVLPHHPMKMMRSGKIHQVPVLSGTNRDEMDYLIAAFYDGAGNPLTAKDYQSMIKAALGDRAAKITKLYSAKDFESPSQAWAAITTDRVFTCPAVVRHAALSESVPAYVYEYAEPGSKADYPGLTFDPGAVHAAELSLLFPDFDKPDELTVDQTKLSETMINYWSSFARTGDPNSDGGPAWAPYSPADRQTPTTQTLASQGTKATDVVADHHCEAWADLDPGVQ